MSKTYDFTNTNNIEYNFNSEEEAKAAVVEALHKDLGEDYDEYFGQDDDDIIQTKHDDIHGNNPDYPFGKYE